ncbi:DUF998 domain-containing protein [Embleya scabrispora]|uniref:DUF998 domain-containing protein n=1 Tax=Embleya scabrispora TaxID=159449 RepID=UPI00036C125D|nr:DUF998 domain-containing protein [Embleya scabrispora]MYS81641.1 DUF998 domain-containing protein [Streptomyces sp. SID5474]
MASTTTTSATTDATRIGISLSTRRLLAAAAVAAPVWVAVSLAQALTRHGFGLTRHPLSALANGSLGWIQVANFLIAGTLFIAGSVGLRRALRGSLGGTWVSRLVLVNGIAMLAAGVFRMDPMDGFPVGTPSGTPDTQTWHSNLHMVSGMVSFAALIAACLVLGRRFTRAGELRSAVVSRAAAATLFLGNAWSLGGGPAGALTMAVGVVTAMTWVSVVAARIRKAA